MRRDANNQTDDELLLTGRLVPAGRDGNKVFARMLRPGEEDPGHGVTLQAGDQLIIRAGGFVIHSEEIDAQSVAGRGGYAPVANTVWTWYHIAGGVQLSFFLFLFSLARRIDAAHALWALAIHERDKAREEGGIPRRIGFFNALATAEVAIVAIHRGITMVHTLAEKFLPELQVPESVEQVRTAVKEMRDAFEHIDERSEGRSGISHKVDPDALTIFNQPDFIESSVLYYKEYVLDFDEDIRSALLGCRETIMRAIDVEAAARSSSP